MSRSDRPDLNGRASQARTASLIRRSLPICWLCNQPIDTTLSGNDDQGPTRHHKHPVSRGGHPTDQTNESLAHRKCNLIAGDMPASESQSYVREQLGLAQTPRIRTRDWGI